MSGDDWNHLNLTCWSVKAMTLGYLYHFLTVLLSPANHFRLSLFFNCSQLSQRQIQSFFLKRMLLFCALPLYLTPQLLLHVQLYQSEPLNFA